MKEKKMKLKLLNGRNENADMPDLADIYTTAYRTLTNLPEKYKPFTHNLIVRVENYPSEEIIDNLKLTDKNDLLGLYRGVPLPLKLSSSNSKLPDIIHLYRCPLIKYARDNHHPIVELIHHVMIHEIGHHFGYSESESEWLEKLEK